MKKIFILIIIVLTFLISFNYKNNKLNILVIGNTYNENAINDFLKKNKVRKIKKIIEIGSNINNINSNIERNKKYYNKPFKNIIIKSDLIVLNLYDNSTFNDKLLSKANAISYINLVNNIKLISKEKLFMVITVEHKNEYLNYFKNIIKNYCNTKEIIVLFR